MIDEATDATRRRLLQGLLSLPALAGMLPVQAAARGEPSSGGLAVVLGGGSARGFAHIGVIKALDAAGIRPSLIVGCSAGSLIGIFWAAGFTGLQMEELALRVRDDEIIDLISGNAQRGMVSGNSLQDFVNRSLRNRPIEALPIPFIAVATEFPSGVLTPIAKGNAGFAVRASCSIPGIFMPAGDGTHDYLDGGLVSPIPVQTARKAGAGLVIAVDIGAPDANPDSGSGLYGLLLRSFEIMNQSLRNHEASQADLVIRPNVSQFASTNFTARKAMIAAGYQAGARMAPLIKDYQARKPNPARK